MHSVSNPANSETLSATPNEAQERGNKPAALHGRGVGVNRKLSGSGIV